MTEQRKPPGPAATYDLVGVVLTYEALIRILRKRKEAAGFSCLELDEAAGLAEGYCGKLFGPGQRRRLGALSLRLLLETLGLRLIVVADSELPVPKRRKNVMQDRGGEKHWRRSAPE
jgi:hypothetical protein